MLSPTHHGTIGSMVGTQLRGLPVSLVGRRRVVRRRRRVLRMRGWLGTGFIACFSLTLFAVTFFSLLGR